MTESSNAQGDEIRRRMHEAEQWQAEAARLRRWVLNITGSCCL